ncbi:MAG: L-ascorbate metabolism protein UlaG (beta-lactamase superfamily) [Aureispira sp.]|jgi:L-ascorbate metabolism protein UlaG (beta-lactamase superfamily)
MKIHHLRNATMIIEAGNQFILVDPMIGPKASLPTFTFFRFKAKRNPIAPFPDNADILLEKVTHCIITHRHPDHLDAAGMKFLIKHNIPVSCSIKDAPILKKKGLNIIQSVNYWERVDFLGGKIEGIPAKHGYGFVAKPMGNVMGFYLQLPNQPSIYLSSDTIYTQDVHKVLSEYQPKISVVAGGSAQLDIFQPLLMTMDDILKFIQNAPEKVIVNHLEAVNHCPTTRTGLKSKLENKQLIHNVSIPEDGESIIF